MSGFSVEDYMEKLGTLSLELARPTGTEARRGTWLDRSGNWGLPVSEIPAYLVKKELNSLQVLRLPALCSGKPTLCIEYCCLVANESESFYRSISKAQWLRTVITLQAPFEVFSSEQDDSMADLVIHSNIVPLQVYLTRLKGTKTTCIKHPCTNLGFFPVSVLRQGGPPCQSCTNCALPKLLGDHMAVHEKEKPGVAVEEEEIDLMDVEKEGKEVDCMVVDQLDKFWCLEMIEVKPLKDIAEGNEGKVSTVLWRKGTFARKRFICSEGTLENTKFRKELGVARIVSHPNIVHCFGFSTCQDSTHLDLFMEFLEEDLESFLDRLENGDPEFTFSFQDSLDVLLQIAEAVEHLHKYFIHGDLKPGNILMSKLAMHSDVPFHLVKVADFGCAQRIDSFGATVEPFDFKIGSPSYTAPEVLRCRKIDSEIRNNRRSAEDLQKELQNINPLKIDVYSFGVIAHKVVTNVSEGTTSVGDHSSLLQFFQRCSASKPDERPSFAEICRRLSSSIMNNHGLREKNAMRMNHKKNTFSRSMVKKVKALWNIKDSSSKCKVWAKPTKRTFI